ncbi:MAG: hypothetical protein ACREPX_07230, partial [Rhodanobacteraceae bacterium]
RKPGPSAFDLAASKALDPGFRRDDGLSCFQCVVEAKRMRRRRRSSQRDITTVRHNDHHRERIKPTARR